MNKMLITLLILLYTCIASSLSHADKIPKIISLNGDSLSTNESMVVLYELSLRYTLFILDANDHLKDDHYYIKIKNENNNYEDPSAELYKRLSDICYEFLPGSEYKPKRIKSESGGYVIIPGPGITVSVRILSSKKVSVQTCSYCGSFSGILLNFMISWRDGIWELEEPDAIGII